ncbi:uncharacterized protein LOC142556982 isoform X2 [Dermacentor variabilis]|uniref:uncharacterized protein LOC142556982 isoform X2 n=1 Tax=Dermacentor variabilis TaxID=34621 RepID=UPI003F5C8CE9
MHSVYAKPPTPLRPHRVCEYARVRGFGGKVIWYMWLTTQVHREEELAAMQSPAGNWSSSCNKIAGTCRTSQWPFECLAEVAAAAPAAGPGRQSASPREG